MIRHRTTYRYTVAVSFAPHVVRLTPLTGTTRLMARHLLASPSPVSVTEETDAFGNPCTRLVFGPEQSSVLELYSRVEVETSEPPRLDGVWSPPLPWSPPAHDALAPYRFAEPNRDVQALAESLCRDVGGAPFAFFERLSCYLHDHFERGLRLEGAAQTPSQTLASGSGACRDLTVLYLAVCRALGVAGRFVSGYQGQEQTPDGQRHLHAWPEVWVPELGWLGWDPMHGIRAGSGHVALCAAPDQAGTMPIEGGYYFNGATITSTLDYSITFEPA